MQVAEARETWTVRRAPQSIGRSGVVFVLCWIMLAATPLTAQQNGGTVIETVATLSDRDVNGKDVVSEKVVTRRSGTSDGEDVVIEIYLPSITWGGRPVLSRRVHRVTTVAGDGSRTVEETEARSLAVPGDPTMRVVSRSVTTVRRSGPDSYISERQEFKLDVNGLFVPVVTETVHTAGR